MGEKSLSAENPLLIEGYINHGEYTHKQ